MIDKQLANQPWVTGIAIMACLSIFAGLAIENDYESWDTLSKFGCLPAGDIWEGGYWALVTSAFVHFELWHVAFNVYWLWVLGSRMERVIGSLPFLAFVVVSALVSSMWQMAVGDATGIGASGVGYALFGFMWRTRQRYPSFQEVLTPQLNQLFFLWLGVCVLLTRLEILNIGNAAHLGGLVFGIVAAGPLVLPERRRLMQASLIALVGISVVPLFWCPWSVTWLGMKAYAAHSEQRYEEAIERYSQIIYQDPLNSWAYVNRSYAYTATGDMKRAKLDWQLAQQIDPTIGEFEFDPNDE